MKLAKEMVVPGTIYKSLTKLIPLNKIRSSVSKEERRWAKSIFIKRPDGTKLRLLVLKPKRIKSETGVLWFHGGGYLTGMPEMVILSMARKLARECVLVSPDYRLAEEEPYPGALNDGYLALCWMRDHAEQLGIARDSLVVGGESAGGGLAAALCMYVRDINNEFAKTGSKYIKNTVTHDYIKIKCQIPLYPMLDDRMQTKSMIGNTAPVWNEESNRAAWALYLKALNGQDTPKYAAPARETDYSGLPPAITFIGTEEPFRDETIEFIKNLDKAGIQVALKIYKGCFHAFDMLCPWTWQAKDACRFVMENFHKIIRC